MNVYDFDKTIYDGDSTIDFYKFCLKRHPIIILAAIKQAIGLILYVTSLIDKKTFKQYFFSFLNFLKNPRNDVESFWDQNILKIKKFYINQQTKEDVVISASPYFLVYEACRRIGISKVIASDVDILSGKFESENFYGEEKVKQYKRTYGEKTIDKFYSDSSSDADMAHIAKKAYLVKGENISPWKFETSENKLNVLEIIRYSFWGGITTVFNLALFYLMISVQINYIFSNIASYCIAVIISYIFNKKFVFSGSRDNGILNFVKYIFIRVISIALDTGLLYITVEFMTMNIYIAKIIVSIVVIIATYVANKLFVFKNRQEV